MRDSASSSSSEGGDFGGGATPRPLVSLRRFPERRDRRESHDERAWCVFFVARHHAAALQGMEQPNHRFANDRHARVAVVPSPRDDQDFVGAIDLLLPEPGLRSRRRRGGGRQRVAKIERALLPKRASSNAWRRPDSPAGWFGRLDARIYSLLSLRSAHAVGPCLLLWVSGDCLDLQVLREADLVAREAARAAEAVAADLLGIARAIDALIADRREELRLQREREHVVDAALERQRLDGVARSRLPTPRPCASRDTAIAAISATDGEYSLSAPHATISPRASTPTT